MAQQISTSDFKKGQYIEIDNTPYILVDNQFVKPGKGQAFSRTRFKNLENGNVLDRTFKSGEKVQLADVEENSMQYLYSDGNLWHFMNEETFEQLGLNNTQVEEVLPFLVEETVCNVIFFKGRAISVTLPNFMNFDIVYTEPGFKGDTSGNTTKPAEINTGHSIQVPLFIETGEKVRVDTRTGSYIERVKE
ncbi:MAG: elongation factor P [Calditrichaeota bacterium]|nr:MAG: elongation factor P [Calditrichota bacterium]